MEKKFKILVTGGFGAIGHNLLEILRLDNKSDLYVIDNLSSGTANINSDVAFTHLDLSNTEKVKKYFKDFHPDYIFHLAAHFANQNSVDHPISDVATNIIGTINLFEAQRNNPNLKKVVLASSSCVYGKNEIMSESTPVLPFDTPYAINKYVGELYAKYYTEIHNIPTVCIRIFNSYGPGEMPGEYRNVIPNFIQKALNNEDLIITGTGDETRDFTYVMETALLLKKLAFSDFSRCEIFNGGTGRKVRIEDLAKLIIQLTESKSSLIFKESRNWDHVKDRCSDISKSRELLNYEPSQELSEGLRRTVEWIKSKNK